jgi:hypothetical protein
VVKSRVWWSTILSVKIWLEGIDCALADQGASSNRHRVVIWQNR